MTKKYKANKSQVIRKLYDLGHDEKEIQTMTDYSKPLIGVVLRNYKAKKKAGKAKKKASKPKYQEFKVYEFTEPKANVEWVETPDPVNSPPHYRTGGVETIDFIEAKDLNYRLGNVVKYVSRAGKKDSDPVQDLEKAAWYLQREIEARKNA